MGYFDGFGENLTRIGPDGRRYYAPIGRWGPIFDVPEASDEDRLRRRWIGFARVMFPIVMVVVLIRPAVFVVLAIGPVAGLLAVLFGLWCARDLPKSSVAWSDLKRITRTEAVTAYSKAVGRRTLFVCLILSIFMTFIGVLMLVLFPGVQIGLATGFLALCTASLYWSFRRAS